MLRSCQILFKPFFGLLSRSIRLPCPSQSSPAPFTSFFTSFFSVLLIILVLRYFPLSSVIISPSQLCSAFFTPSFSPFLIFSIWLFIYTPFPASSLSGLFPPPYQFSFIFPSLCPSQLPPPSHPSHRPLFNQYQHSSSTFCSISYHSLPSKPFSQPLSKPFSKTSPTTFPFPLPSQTLLHVFFFYRFHLFTPFHLPLHLFSFSALQISLNPSQNSLLLNFPFSISTPSRVLNPLL